MLQLGIRRLQDVVVGPGADVKQLPNFRSDPAADLKTEPLHLTEFDSPARCFDHDKAATITKSRFASTIRNTFVTSVKAAEKALCSTCCSAVQTRLYKSDAKLSKHSETVCFRLSDELLDELVDGGKSFSDAQFQPGVLIN